MIVQEWMERPRARLVGGALAAGCIVLAIRAFVAGDVPAELSWVALGGACWALGALLASGRGWVLWTALAAALTTVLWWREHPVLAVLAAVAAIVASAYARRFIRRREDACRYLAKLAAILGKETRDDRKPGRIITPLAGPWRPTDETRRGAAVGLPLRWHVPPHVPVDEGARLLLLTAVAEVCKVHTSVRMRRESIDVRPAPEAGPELADEGSEEVDRLNDAVRSAMGPEVAVVGTTREDDEMLAAFTLGWPPSYALKASNVAVRNRVLKAAGAVLGGAWKADGWDTETGRAEFSRMAQLPRRIPHPGRDETNPDRAEFATLRNGGTGYMSLTNENPHAIIVGTTSTGKTSLLRTLLVGMPPNTRAFLVDPKRASMLGLDQLPIVESLATRPETMAETLRAFREEMLARYELLETRQKTTKNLSPRVLVIDEGEMLFDMLDDWWKIEEKENVKEQHAKRDALRKKQEKEGVQPGETAVDDMPAIPAAVGTHHPAIVWLKNILQAGRQARMYVILGSQQADASWLGTSARNQFSLRIAMSNLDQIGSRQIFGTMGAVSGLDPYKGRAWIGMGNGAIYPEQAQVWWVPELEADPTPEDLEILERLDLAVDEAPLARIPSAPSEPHVPEEQHLPEEQAPSSASRGPGQMPTAEPIPEETSLDSTPPTSASSDHAENEASPQVTVVKPSSGAPESTPPEQAEPDSSSEEDRPGAARETVTALDLEEGDIWWTDLGEGSLEPVEVITVEVDMHDVELLEITYRTEAGDAVVSIPEDEAVEREAP